MRQTNFTPPLTEHSHLIDMSSAPWHKIPGKQPTMRQRFRHMASKGLFSSFVSIVPENDICQGCQAKQLLASFTSVIKFDLVSLGFYARQAQRDD